MTKLAVLALTLVPVLIVTGFVWLATGSTKLAIIGGLTAAAYVRYKCYKITGK